MATTSATNNSDEQTLTPTVVGGVTTEVSIENGNTIPILHTEIPSLSLTGRIIYVEEYFARSADGLAQSGNRNLTITRTAVGRWTAVLATAHPDGVNYHPSVTAEEQSANRDTPNINIVQGSVTATGFQYEIVTGDNSGNADVYVDTPHTVAITAPVSVVTDVSFI